jgi:hypothetical protein
MVGDIRQSVLSTNPRGQKNKQYQYANAIQWFRDRQNKGLLEINERNSTWRCRPEIAALSDTIFDKDWGFPKTESKNEKITGHDGVFFVKERDVYTYVENFQPQCLRHGASSGKNFSLNFINFKVAKGATFDRVLIIPTDGIAKFLQTGKNLEPGPAAAFYVAVTRAAQSVAIALENPGNSIFQYWQPSKDATQ